MTAWKTHSSTNPDQPAPEFEAFDRTIAAMVSNQTDIVVAPLSDLSRSGAQRLLAIWPTLPDEARARAVKAMVDDGLEQIERTYTRALLVGVDDPLPEVRDFAFEGLRGSESDAVLELLLARIDVEANDRVRATMTELLGEYALAAEVGELDQNRGELVRETLIRLLHDDPVPTVRRHALESVAFFAGDSDVAEEIEAAYASKDFDSRQSALRGMGRQADVRWRPAISVEMSNSDPEIRFVAVHAAGVSGDHTFISALLDLTDDEDFEIRLAAIEALGSIGGAMAVRILRRLLQDESEAIAAAAGDALEEALLSVGQIHPSVPLDRSEDETDQGY